MLHDVTNTSKYIKYVPVPIVINDIIIILLEIYKKYSGNIHFIYHIIRLKTTEVDRHYLC